MPAARGMVGPIRVLPVTMAAAGLLLVLRVTELWTEVSVSAAGQAEAQVSLEPLIVPAAGSGDEAADSDHDQPVPDEHETADAAADTHAADTDAADDPHADDGTLPLPDLLGTSTFTPAEVEVLTELAKRRENLDGRERELGLREGLLQAAERRLDDKIGELEVLRSEIEALVGQHDEQEETELQSLVKIYETMKPKDAARILQELEMQILLSIMERMKERSTAPVLAAMDASRAREVTAELARRRELNPPNG